MSSTFAPARAITELSSTVFSFKITEISDHNGCLCVGRGAVSSKLSAQPPIERHQLNIPIVPNNSVFVQCALFYAAVSAAVKAQNTKQSALTLHFEQ